MFKYFKIIILILIIVLVGARLALPHYLRVYVVNQINQLPGYHAQIADIDVHLIAGSYTIKDMQLWKINKNIPVPFFKSKLIKLSIQWRALLHGSIVAEINVQKPSLNFVDDPNGNNSQLTISEKWVDIVKSLFPFNINKLSIDDGQISFRSYNGKSPFNTYINNVDFTIENMQNAQKARELLSSQFKFTGNPMDGGKINIEGKFNPFIKQPTFYLKGSLTNLNIAQIKNLLKEYTNVDVTSGTFKLYMEMVAAKGKIDGYAKPFLKNLKIDTPKNASVLDHIYNGAAALVAKIVENPKQKTIATKVKLEGRVDDPNISIWSVIGYMLRHAFIQALIPQIDHNIKMQNVIYGK